MRAPFDPLPYAALVESCERFFEYLVAVRQSSIFFHPRFVRDNDDAVGRLLIYRRDAVASIINNLFTLAGALRTSRKVPVSSPLVFHSLLARLSYFPSHCQTRLIRN